jgi:hypothetical protein
MKQGIAVTTQTTHFYHYSSPQWTALSFSAIGWLLRENDALPMRRLAALKTSILNGHRYRL